MSKTFTLSIECDNAAFSDRHGAPEVARILDVLSARLRGDCRLADAVIRDCNGNSIGRAQFTDEAR